MDLKSMSWSRAIAATFMLSLASGCTSTMVRSQSVDSANGQAGLVYALPKAQVELKASRRLVAAQDIDKAKSAMEAASAASADATAAAAKAKSTKEAAELAKTKAASQAVGEDALAYFALELEKATVLAAVASGTAEAKAKAAAEAAATYKAQLDSKDRCLEIGSLKLLPPAPDLTRRYVVNHMTSDSRDDVLSLTVSNGMLSSGTGVATGQPSAAITSLIGAVAGSLGKPGVVTVMSKTPSPPVPGTCEEYDVAVVFDPTDKCELDKAERTVTDVKANLALRNLGEEAKPSAAPSEALDGLAYRTIRPIHLELASKRGANDSTRSDETARLYGLVPDASSTFVLPVQATAWSRTTTKYVFKDGTPIEMSVDRQNPMVAVASLPVEALKALVSVPAELIKLRVDYSSQQSALTEQQVKILEAQTALIKAQKDLDDARADKTP